MKFPEWSDERLRELADAEPSGLMACSPELLTKLIELAKIDPAVAAVLIAAGVKLEKKRAALKKESLECD